MRSTESVTNLSHFRAGSKADETQKPKIVLIDDDPTYATILTRCAEMEGIQMDTYHSLSELGFVSLLSNYDLAIVDYDLGDFNGVEIAEYMSSLLQNMPMVLISATDRSREIASCPRCVKAFLKKSAGYTQILNVAKKFLPKTETA